MHEEEAIFAVRGATQAVEEGGERLGRRGRREEGTREGVVEGLAKRNVPKSSTVSVPSSACVLAWSFLCGWLCPNLFFFF